ncbi:hypothetical protein BCL90_2010 [Pedobacter alluvionis]|uniref:Uncharacterized protein n=1 Tax=Pedobacter alluvionis TaxID=475253 RepID=A0A497Y4K6_9SPHI|nr:hypothetical protein BCL90_2010 [Pedobacter alluvionis]
MPNTNASSKMFRYEYLIINKGWGKQCSVGLFAFLQAFRSDLFAQYLNGQAAKKVLPFNPV